jgi:hypothetical protein
MAKYWRLVLCVISFTGLAGLSPAASADEGEVGLRVTPLVAQVPAHVNIVVQIPRAVDNRLLRITLDSGAFYRSSDVPLDGDKAAVQHLLTWRGIVAGSYDVVAELYGPANRKKIVRRQLQVMGVGHD